MAISRLEHSCLTHSGPVAWGNTNLGPLNYKVALSLANQTKRPVNFILWYIMIMMLHVSYNVEIDVFNIHTYISYICGWFCNCLIYNQIIVWVNINVYHPMVK